MTISDKTIARYDRLVARAIKAGRTAAAKAAREAARGEKTTIVDNRTKRTWSMVGYPYGRAYVRVSSGRTGFAQYLKSKNALGWENRIEDYVLDRDRQVFKPQSLGQSMQVATAKAEAWAAVLNKAGISTCVETWID
jgi:hypothetical protein